MGAQPVLQTPIEVVWFAGAVMLLAYFVRGVTGFGSSLISVPLLAIVVPLPVIVPVVTALDCITSITHAGRGWRFVVWRELLPLAPFVAAGFVVALYVLQTADPALLKRLLGLFVLGYALLQIGKNRVGNPFRRAASMMGLMAGVTNGTFAMGGPFYVMYLHLRGLSKQQFRATFALIAVADTGVRTTGYLYSGLLDEVLLVTVAGFLPLVLCALYLGGHVHVKSSEGAFETAVIALLVGSGVLLLIG